MVPAGQVALAVSARFGRDPPAITAGLVWRVYGEKADQNGTFRLLREDRTASPVFLLAPGGYIIHVSFGLANAVKRVNLRSDTVRELFEIAAGGARFEGKVGDARIPVGQIHFDLYKGSQFELGEKRPIAENVAAADVVVLPEGLYHVVSNYGDGNAVMRSDLRIQPGKLVDTTIVHRAAKITLKLVGEKGGEALANTAWSVLTPGGDVIKESIGAFPIVVLAEGDYVAIARNEGKVYNRDFRSNPASTARSKSWRAELLLTDGFDACARGGPGNFDVRCRSHVRLGRRRRQRSTAGAALVRLLPCCRPDQREASADAPPFASIAKTPGFDAQKIAFFLLEPHPKMPPMALSRRDAEDLAAYMVRLADDRSRRGRRKSDCDRHLRCGSAFRHRRGGGADFGRRLARPRT